MMTQPPGGWLPPAPGAPDEDRHRDRDCAAQGRELVSRRGSGGRDRDAHSDGRRSQGAMRRDDLRNGRVGPHHVRRQAGEGATNAAICSPSPRVSPENAASRMLRPDADRSNGRRMPRRTSSRRSETKCSWRTASSPFEHAPPISAIIGSTRAPQELERTEALRVGRGAPPSAPFLDARERARSATGAPRDGRDRGAARRFDRRGATRAGARRAARSGRPMSSRQRFRDAAKAPDVRERVQAMAGRAALRNREAVALLPHAKRVRRKPGGPRHRPNREARLGGSPRSGPGLKVDSGAVFCPCSCFGRHRKRGRDGPSRPCHQASLEEQLECQAGRIPDFARERFSRPCRKPAFTG